MTKQFEKTEQLKPCPFCGGKAVLRHFYPAFGARMRSKVICKKCRCNSGEWGRTDKAVEAWNRRADNG